DLDDGDRALGLDADAVADHQVGQTGAVDEHNAGGYRFGVSTGAGAEPRRGDEDALTCLIAVERPNKRLDLGAADGRFGGVALGLDVDAAETECVLVDDAVDPAVVGQLGSRGVPLGTAITHRDQEVEHCLFEESWIIGVQAGEEVGGDFGVNAGDAVLNLFRGRERGGVLGPLRVRQLFFGLSCARRNISWNVTEISLCDAIAVSVKEVSADLTNLVVAPFRPINRSSAGEI